VHWSYRIGVVIYWQVIKCLDILNFVLSQEQPQARFKNLNCARLPVNWLNAITNSPLNNDEQQDGACMKTRRVEYAIIGSGTAGLGAYSRIHRSTDNYVMIQHGPYGTTCARVGCMPSKMLITAADHAHEFTQGAAFGINGEAQVDGKKVLNRIRKDRAKKFVGNVLKQIGKIPDEVKLQGFAKFLSNNQIQVNDYLIIEAHKIIIACGTRPYLPKVLLPVVSKVFTSDTIFEIEQLPGSVAVIGLGVIALELGQSLHRLGVDTTLYGRSGRVGGLTHPDLQAETLSCLSNDLAIYSEGDIIKTWEEAGQRLLSTNRLMAI
jgi:dihydrolipoamide dehydrogenase